MTLQEQLAQIVKRAQRKVRCPTCAGNPYFSSHWPCQNCHGTGQVPNPSRLLDLFCGAGGAGKGYADAGFEVYGVDNDPKPLRHYPFPHVCTDALEVLGKLLKGEGITFFNNETLYLADFAAIHASPPCQRYTTLKRMWNAREHPDLIAPTRAALQKTGRPWVIENVPGAPLEHPIMLCGSMFKLGCEGAELRRHRIFETSFPCAVSLVCVHGWSGEDSATVRVYGHVGGYSQRQRYCVIGVYGGHGRDRRRRKNGQHFPTDMRRQAMGISWMTGTELTQAIPPAYTRFLGARLMEVVRPGMRLGVEPEAACP